MWDAPQAARSGRKVKGVSMVMFPDVTRPAGSPQVAPAPRTDDYEIVGGRRILRPMHARWGAGFRNPHPPPRQKALVVPPTDYTVTPAHRVTV
jgi:hypothetical protein